MAPCAGRVWVAMTLAAALVAATTTSVAAQRVDVIPTMPPPAVCDAPTSSPPPTANAPVVAGPASTRPDDLVRVTLAPSTDRPERLATWRGSWDEGADPAIAPRTDAVTMTISTGPFRTILWGGVGADGQLLGDGVVIDDSGASRVLPAAPICPRRDFAWALVSTGVMIWGGTDVAGRPFGDGAIYSFDNGTWSMVPSSPLPAGPAIGVTGAVMVRDPATGRGLLSRIATRGDALGWSTPVTVPLPVGRSYELVCCDADALLVLSVQADGFAFAAAMGQEWPHDGEWSMLGRVPLPAGDGGGPVSGRATERSLTAWVRSADAPLAGTDVSGPVGLIARTDRPTRPWRLTAPPPAGAANDPSLVLSPTHLISVQGMVAYDLMADRWLRIPGCGCRPFADLEGATAWWSDGRLWVFGGRTDDGSMASVLRWFTPRLHRNERALPSRPDLHGYAEGCVAFAVDGTWRLRGSLDDPQLVWTQSGRKRQATHWPEGWIARFDPDLEVVDTRGRVRYRDRDVCETFAGSGG